jgi:2-methylcitrate dehydratase PrpD
MSRAREVSKVISTVQLVEDSIDNIDLSSSINTASAAAVAYLIDGAPAALNTLNELAAALNDNESFATTVTNELSSKLSISSASATYLPQTTASATYLPLSGGSVSGNLSVSGYLTNQSVFSTCNL